MARPPLYREVTHRHHELGTGLVAEVAPTSIAGGRWDRLGVVAGGVLVAMNVFVIATVSRHKNTQHVLARPANH